MSSFKCPFCNVTMPVTNDTHSRRFPSFDYDVGQFYVPNKQFTDNSCLGVDFYKCPDCNKYSIVASGIGRDTKGLKSYLLPNSLAKQFPKYVPKAIRDDYEEAYSILNLSPKASATLSRRCLQGMIRDFYGIKKSRLIDEINELQSIVPNTQWKAIDGVRSIGNIGAHMEKDINMIVDVDPDEAQKLLKLIELLMDKWYVARHDEEELLSDIIAIADEKKTQKQSASNQ